MASPFARTLRALEVDRQGAAIRMTLLIVVLLAGWVAWSTSARVTVVASSREAHLEVISTASSVQAARPGRLRRVEVELGDHVRAGQRLFVLDSKDAELALEQLDAEIAGLEAERDLVGARLAVATAARHEGDALTKALEAETAARIAELTTRADAAQDVAERSERLFETGAIDQERLESDRAEAKRLRHATRAVARAQRKETHSTRLSLSDRAGTLSALEQELEGLGAQLDGRRIARRRLEHQRGELEIRAPVTGRVGELSDRRAGSWVASGEELARVVPDERVQVTAVFSAADAVGRIEPEQRGRLRLDGFPWTQYGTVEARVVQVAAEPRQGLVRVQLEVDEHHARVGTLQHGMPGQVEIEVEEVAPIILLLRAAGAWLGAPPAPEPSAS